MVFCSTLDGVRFWSQKFLSTLSNQNLPIEISFRIYFFSTIQTFHKIVPHQFFGFKRSQNCTLRRFLLIFYPIVYKSTSFHDVNSLYFASNHVNPIIKFFSSLSIWSQICPQTLTLNMCLNFQHFTWEFILWIIL